MPITRSRISHSQTRALGVLDKDDYIFNSISSLRFYCSCCNGNEEELGRNVKPRSKSARAISRLINSKSWSKDLLSSLSSLSPSLSKTTVLQTLRLINTPSKAYHFFKWVQEMGFTHDSQSYFLVLEIMGRERNLNVARNFLFSIEKRSNGAVKLEDRFFNSLIRNFGRAGLLQESIKLFSIMKSIGVSPSAVTFNSLLLILLQRGRTNMAKNVYDEMLGTYGVKPDTFTYNILIRGFCKNSMVDEGFQFFKEMTRFECDPDIITYNTLVDGLCRAGKVRIAHNLVNGMSKKSKDLNPNVITFTALVRGYCMKQEIDEAFRILEEMAGQGLKANRITYNTLIKGLCEAQKFDRIKEVLEGIVISGGFTPDTCTFNTLMHAHCTAGNTDEAVKVFEKMKELQVLADSATYSILIRSLCQRKDYDKAERLIDELSGREVLLSNGGCKPLAAAYNPMFEYMCQHGKTKKAERVFRQLMKRGIQDPPSYKTLIVGHCKEGDYVAGYELLVWMLRRDFRPDIETYEILIDGLLKAKPLLALKTLEKMLRSSHLPKTSTFHSVLAALQKKKFACESAGLIAVMLERKFRQNVNLSTQSLLLLFNAGMWDKAFQIVELLYESGYSVKITELVDWLCQKRKTLEASKLLRFTLEKHHHNGHIDIFNKVILELCKINMLSEAFSLYYQLVERGIHAQLTCLYDLKSALEDVGRLDEASFVLKRLPAEKSFS